MVKTRRFPIALVSAFLSLAFSCNAYPPVIKNTLDRPIVLTVRYGDGTSLSSFEAPPGAQIWCRAKGTTLDEVEVSSQDKLLFRLSKVELDRMLTDIPAGAKVMWEIDETGIKPTIMPN